MSLIPKRLVSIGFLCIYLSLAIGSNDLIDCTNVETWKKAVAIAKEIEDNQHVISTNELMVNLYKIKTVLSQNVFKTIIQKINAKERQILVPALCLLRLSNVNADQCLQSNDKKNTLLQNQHQGNFIEITNHINSNYKSKTILDLAGRFFQAQLYICRNSLLVNFGKWHKHLADHGTQFAQSLAKHFNGLELVQFDALSVNAKAAKLLEFFISYYSLDVLKRYSTTNAMMTTGKNQMKKFNRDCEVYLLDPYKTLMMTYNETGRNLPILEYHYGYIIKAYDYCLKLQLAMGLAETNALTKYYQGMLMRGNAGETTIIDIGAIATKRGPADTMALQRKRFKIDNPIIQEAHYQSLASQVSSNERNRLNELTQIDKTLEQPSLITQHEPANSQDQPAESTGSSD